MSDSMYHSTSPAVAARRKELAPHIHQGFDQFGKAVFSNDEIPSVTKQLIAVAVAHTTQCPY